MCSEKDSAAAIRGSPGGVSGHRFDDMNASVLEAERAREPAKLLDRDDFIRLLLEHYEALGPEYKAQIPLGKVWVPIE
jgi:predicted Mrr-cat superfamily restriction endonuclease